MLNWLLICVPIAIGLEFFRPQAHSLIFLMSCLAIVPLAGWLGRATEHLAHHTGEAIGGLLNATLGNAAEFIIAIMALRRGLYAVVKASLTGSIIGNVLLVLGAAALAGGMKFQVQRFNAVAARTLATLLTLAAIALVVPAAFHYIAGPGSKIHENNLGLEIAIVLLVAYGAYLVFSLHTHKGILAGDPGEDDTHTPEKPWNLRNALLVLAGVTALIAWMSEILIGSVEEAAKSFGMTNVFVGVIVVAIVGNAAEHSTAVLMAMKNRMEIAMQIAIGSSLQIALLVAPLLIILSRFIGPEPMDLVFTPAEVLAVFVSVMIAGQVTSDGDSNWLEGTLLLALYVILAIVFYLLPDAPIETPLAAPAK
jgi:Ca2+:H+ antiporter